MKPCWSPDRQNGPVSAANYLWQNYIVFCCMYELTVTVCCTHIFYNICNVKFDISLFLLQQVLQSQIVSFVLNRKLQSVWRLKGNQFLMQLAEHKLKLYDYFRLNKQRNLVKFECSICFWGTRYICT